METESLLPIENILKPISVRELLVNDGDKPTYHFYIPSYQRGYRWGTVEVTALLDDIIEFSIEKKSNKERYCLQPIVVKRMENESFEVLDGQQRLTTLYILLRWLSKKIEDISFFDIEYETRPNSKTFLEQLGSSLDDSNPDYYYINNAFNEIGTWFEINKSIGNLAYKIYNEIFDYVDFIWYEIKDSTVNPIDVFTRINVGKIPLTNSELVKAVFLSKDNLALGLAEEVDATTFKITLSNKQSLIAMEWDQMEKQLQNENFWRFIFNGESDRYETRIDYILDLVTKKKPAEKNHYYAFQTFYSNLKRIRLDPTLVTTLRDQNSSLVEQEWNILKQYFDILEEWYHHKLFNHLIGFLIYSNENLLDLLDLYKNNDRRNFLNTIVDLVNSHISCDLKDLKYGSNDTKIRTILVFHNIMHSLIQPDTANQFAFDKIKDGRKWSLEHIFAQNSDDIREVDQQIWAQDHLRHFQTYYPREQIINSLSKIANKEKSDRDEFLVLFKKVEEFTQSLLLKETEVFSDTEQDEWSWVDEDHAISNLTLLDVSSNSALSNSVFAIKRDKIRMLDSQSAYIPNETRKVFFKYYSEQLGSDAYWTRTDKIAYINDIKKMVQKLNEIKK